MINEKLMEEKKIKIVVRIYFYSVAVKYLLVFGFFFGSLKVNLKKKILYRTMYAETLII